MIGNTQLQNHIYSRIDELFAGAGAYATLTLGGLLAVEGFGVHTFSAGGAGGHALAVRNSSSGTTNSAQVRVGNDGSATAGILAHTASNYTAGGSYQQDGLSIVGSRAGGLTLSSESTSATAHIRFYTNPGAGVTLRGYVDAATGVLQWSGGSGLHTFTENSNQSTGMQIRQSNAGTTASAQVQIGNDGSASAVRLIHTSSGFTTAGTVYRQDSFVIDATRAGGIVISASNASGDIRFHTGGSSSYNWLMQNNGSFDLAKPEVAHGMTSVAPTDTYGRMSAHDSALGGILIAGLSESTQGVRIAGIVTTDSNARSTSAVAPVIIDGNLKSGTSTTTCGADQNLVVIRNAATTRFIFDSDGDFHLDATSNANAFDDHEDVAVLEAFRVLTARPNFKHRFATDIRQHEAVLRRGGILSAGGFVSYKGLQALVIDAIRQEAWRTRQLEARVAALEA